MHRDTTEVYSSCTVYTVF